MLTVVRKTEHAANNCGVLDRPSVVTNRTPQSVIEYLYSTITLSYTICQSHVSQHLTCSIISIIRIINVM